LARGTAVAGRPARPLPPLSSILAHGPMDAHALRAVAALIGTATREVHGSTWHAFIGGSDFLHAGTREMFFVFL